MGFAAWILVGVVAGWTAWAMRPDGEPAELAGRMLVGALGAAVGGATASLLGSGSAGAFFDLGAWLFALVGAAAPLAIQHLLPGAGRLTQRHRPR